MFTPARETRLLFECKGGDPTFNDIRKFSTLRYLLDPSPDDMIVIARHNFSPNRIDLATQLGVRMVERTHLAHYVIPMLGGAADRDLRARQLNPYLAWQGVHDYLVARTPSHPQMKQHYRFLVSKLWSIGHHRQQVELSFDGYQRRFPQTWDVVAQARGTTSLQNAYDAANDDVEAATYTVMIHRIMNAYAVTRRTIFLMQHCSPMELVRSTGPNLRASVKRLTSEPRWLLGFPAFLQDFFFVWGGFIYKPERLHEIQMMASLASTSPEAVEHYLQVLDELYTSVGGSLFQDWQDMYYFKHVPGAFRAIGALNRAAKYPALYGGKAYWAGNDANYLAALDRALNRWGGRAALHF